MSETDYSDSQSSEYLSEHESDREFVENDESQQDSEEYNPSEDPSSEEFTEYEEYAGSQK
jgi:hypothetical protein